MVLDFIVAGDFLYAGIFQKFLYSGKWEKTIFMLQNCVVYIFFTFPLAFNILRNSKIKVHSEVILTVQNMKDERELFKGAKYRRYFVAEVKKKAVVKW